jgi:D-serine deaminase-like pyridoxal phosphate-dependent protein
MHRTGIAPNDEAYALYCSFANYPGIIPGGIHAYDGHLHQSNYDELCRVATTTFQPVWELRDRLEATGHAVPTIVASGTSTSMMMTKQPNVEVGAGTTVLWDSGYEKICPQYDFQHAALVLARAHSKPQADLLCVDLGYKAIASESPPPRVCFFGLEEAVPVIHSEEHLVLQTPRARDFSVGSVLYGIPHHICPTVALHQEAWCVRDGRAVEAWPVVARNRRITI